jgi:hypothetical protein
MSIAMTHHETWQPRIADYRRPARTGFAIVAVTFGIFGAWAAYAPLDSAGAQNRHGDRDRDQGRDASIRRAAAVA